MRRNVALAVLAITIGLVWLCSPLIQLMSIAAIDEPIIEVSDALFVFGWSATAGEKMLVQGEIIMLSSKAMVAPSLELTEGDGGSFQTNSYEIYVNNIGFYFGWSTDVTDRYRPSTSSTVGASQAFNNRGPTEPQSTPVSEDAGSTQENPAMIYLNNIGFCFGWSSNSSDVYRPSPNMEAGPSTSFNDKALIVPNSWAFGIDHTAPVSSDNYDGTWYNMDFSIILTASDSQSGIAVTYYRVNNGPTRSVSIDGQPNITAEGPNNTLEYWSMDNSANEELPHKFIVEIKLDKTNPTIGTLSRTPDGNIQPNQGANVAANATDAISGVKRVILLYALNNGTTWIYSQMNYNLSTSLFETTIPGQQVDTWVRYEIVAYDYAGNNATRDGTDPYFVYHVVPEFPSFLILPLLMIATLLAVTIYQKKH